MSSPWHVAYELLKAYVGSGASPEDVMKFAREIRRDVPTPCDAEERAQLAEVQAMVIADREEAETRHARGQIRKIADEMKGTRDG